MRWLVLLLVGCATASTDKLSGNNDVDSGVGQHDANQVTLDAPLLIDAPKMIDAPSGPTTRTLSQTTSQALKGGNTIACASNTTGNTRANNFYRVFDLAAFGINSAFTVTKVSFQIEHCHSANSTGCTVAVRVGTYSGTPGTTLATGSIAVLASSPTVAVPEVVESGTTTPGGTVNAPISATIPAGQKLLVEVDAPDGNTGNTFAFYMGSNDGGENGFGYVMSTTCSINSPTSLSTLGTPAPRHLLLTVTGTY